MLKNTDDTIGEIIALFDQSWNDWEEAYTNWIIKLTAKYNSIGAGGGLGHVVALGGAGAGAGAVMAGEGNDDVMSTMELTLKPEDASFDCPCFVSSFCQSQQPTDPS